MPLRFAVIDPTHRAYGQALQNTKYCCRSFIGLVAPIPKHIELAFVPAEHSLYQFKRIACSFDSGGSFNLWRLSPNPLHSLSEFEAI